MSQTGLFPNYFCQPAIPTTRDASKLAKHFQKRQEERRSSYLGSEQGMLLENARAHRRRCIVSSTDSHPESEFAHAQHLAHDGGGGLSKAAVTWEDCARLAPLSWRDTAHSTE